MYVCGEIIAKKQLNVMVITAIIFHGKVFEEWLLRTMQDQLFSEKGSNHLATPRLPLVTIFQNVSSNLSKMYSSVRLIYQIS